MEWDMECSALFSAAAAVGAQVAAALVVSYTTAECCAIGEQGVKLRSDAEGVLAHSVENVLIIEAIRYLFESSK